jgi:nitroreductase
MDDFSDTPERNPPHAGAEREQRSLPATIATILSRKSVAPKRLKEPGPSDAEIDLMVQAALAAPDHGSLRPWRVLLIRSSERQALAEVFRAAKREEEPTASQDDIDKAGEKAFNAPTLLAIVVEPAVGHPKATVEEQFVALGAAMQNMLLTAHSLGYAAMITSGEKLRTNALQSIFVRRSSERVVAFISVGTLASGLPARSAADASSRLSDWRGPADATQSPADKQ